MAAKLSQMAWGQVMEAAEFKLALVGKWKFLRRMMTDWKQNLNVC